MLYAFACSDRPDSVERRLTTRPDHFAIAGFFQLVDIRSRGRVINSREN